MSDERLDELVDNFMGGLLSMQVNRDDLRRFVKRMIERESDDSTCGNCGADLRECEACGAR